MIPLSQLVRELPGVRVEGSLAWEITGVSLDSRRVEPGHVFAALPGKNVDGRSHAAAAVSKGACAVLAAPPRPDVPPDVAWIVSEAPRRALALLCRRFWRRPDERTRVVGITGTDGKTTTAKLVAAALEAAGQRAATSGTLGRTWSDRREPSTLTTPEATELWPFLAQVADAGDDAVAIEVSSAALVAERVHGVRFAAGVLTGLGRDHLDLHGSLDAYRAAKRRLFRALPADAVAVLPAGSGFDDFRNETRARIVTFGSGSSADWRVEQHRPGPRGATFRLRGPGLNEALESPRPAPWDAQNVACAVAVAANLGADPSQAARGAAGFRSIAGRWETIDAGQEFLAVVDYAHTPEALERVLRLARRIGEGRVLVVFGCGGDRDAGKRPEMGRIAAELADRAFVTDDNPRGEDPEAIANAILAGVPDDATRPDRIPDRAAAIVRAADEAGSGDVVIVAGKGHETTQEFADQTVPFDDRETLRAAIVSARTRR